MYETVTTNIMVQSVSETVKFYESKLGFHKIISVPEEGEILDFAIMGKDNITIMFQSQTSLEEEYKSLKTEKIQPTFTLFIAVKNVQELYEELKDKVTLATDLHQTIYQTEEFAIFDNNNNILTISSE